MAKLVYLFVLLVLGAVAPRAATAWAWGALWPVYDGAWGHEQNCRSNTNMNWGAYSSHAGCDINSPIGIIAASANGAIQATAQPLPTFTLVDTGIVVGYDMNGFAITQTYNKLNLRAPATRGGQVSVAPGTPVTIEWSCLNYIDASAGGGGCGPLGCNITGHEDFGTTIYSIYSSSGGNGFTTGGALYGSQTVRPTMTTTYTLQCVGAPTGYTLINAFGSDLKYMPNAQLSVTVNITDPCPTAVNGGWNGGWLLYPGGPRRFNAGGHNMCLTNNSGKYLFIGRSQGEIDSFFNALSRLGVTQQ